MVAMPSMFVTATAPDGCKWAVAMMMASFVSLSLTDKSMVKPPAVFCAHNGMDVNSSNSVEIVLVSLISVLKY
jgi:hypothetical protein